MRTAISTCLRLLASGAVLSGLVTAQAYSPWTVTPLPALATRSAFNDVDAFASNDAWAVGFVDGTYLGNAVTSSLAMHWDGSNWTPVATPSPPPTPTSQTYNVMLNTVCMVSSNDVWAAGEALTQVGGGGVFGQWVHFQHWDGTSWSVVPALLPSVTTAASGTRVHDSVALAANDVWFGGAWLEPSPTGSFQRRPLAAHWDGQSITVFPTPVLQGAASPDGFSIASFSALASNDIWAVCRAQGVTGASTLTMILHWDGATWSQAMVPSTTVLHRMRSIVALAPNDVWAFGSDYYAPYAAHDYHYDGTSWTLVAAAPRALSGVAVGANDMILGVDATITHFDGTTATVVEGFPGLTGAAIWAFAREPGGTLFAVGSQFVSASPPTRPLAAILMAPTGGPNAMVTPRFPCIAAAPPASLTPLTLPVLGGTAIVAVDDPTHATGFAPTSTLTWWMVSLGAGPNAPCGILVPGLGLGGGPGELLIDPSPGVFLASTGPVAWGGPGQPALHFGVIPNLSVLAGLPLYTQAVLVDFSSAPPSGVLTNGLDLVIGN